MKNLKLKVPENAEINISHENGFRVVEIKAVESFEIPDLLEIEPEKSRFEIEVEKLKQEAVVNYGKLLDLEKEINANT